MVTFLRAPQFMSPDGNKKHTLEMEFDLVADK